MKKILFIILIISLLSFNNGYSQNCTAQFSYQVDSIAQTIQFTDESYSTDSTITPVNWTWTVNGSTISNSQNPEYQYTDTFLYVCLDVDFNQNCSNFICDTILTSLNNSTNCTADFSYNFDSLNNQFVFTNNSVSNELICGNYWDFGDGTYSSIENPTHSYSVSGNYEVCLIITSSSDSCNTISCIDTICKTINYNQANSTISISGNIFAKTALLPKGIAVLYKVVDTNYTAVSYTQINNGFYIFDSLNSGNYLVYAVPYFGDIENYYPVYFPTYSGDQVFYKYAQTDFVDSVVNRDIHLDYNENIYHGSGNISGKLVYDYGSNFETNIFNQNWFSGLKSDYEGFAQNITVLLYNMYGNIVKYSLTNQYGNFEFKNIPEGVYIIYVEKAGKKTKAVKAILNEENNTTDNILIHITEEEIINVENIKNISAKIYPNPFCDYININLDRKYTEINISISDISGKQVFSLNRKNSKNILINTNKLSKGSYVIILKTGNNNIYRKKLIK